MLWRAVQTGSWPATRKDLFELSTALMLQEFDLNRARSGSGIYSVAELRPVAGAICAARLISDVEAISLTDQEGTSELPGYRSLAFFAPQKTQAALGRRIFVTGPAPESIDYAHRTTAEYLAAAFLADRIRGGLPFGRVIALIGVEGHPATELRGLHAWLAVHLPEYANQLIEADPYGVLTYGDAAALAPSSRGYLVRALARLSRTNPWFRSGNWQSPAIGALARPDMVNEFRTILRDLDAGLAIRSVVVDALRLGMPLPEMISDLADILPRDVSPYAERLHALHALLRLGASGKLAVMNAFRTGLGRTAHGLRLRIEIIQSLYGEPFTFNDVIAVVNDTLDAEGTINTGMFWTLADYIQPAEFPDILDAIHPPKHDNGGKDRRSWEVGSFYVNILIRAWRAPGTFDSRRMLGWLHKRVAFNSGYSESRARELLSAMKEAPSRLRTIADHFFQTLVVDDNRWFRFARFREVILFALSADTLLDIIVDYMKAAEDGNERQLFLYEVALTLSYQAEPPRAGVMFEELYSLGDMKTSLGEARGRSVVLNLPDTYFAGRSRRGIENEGNRERQRQGFDQEEERIRAGEHLGWITHLGRIYFGWYSDVDRSMGPRQRLAAWLGETRVQAAITSLRAALSRDDIPTFSDVMALTRDHQHYDWWYALVAGLNERWATGEEFSQLSNDFVKALVAFDLANPVFSSQGGTEKIDVHPWKKALLDQHPELVRDAYVAVARARLSRNETHADGLRELMTDLPFEPFRKDIASQLLHHFPNAITNQLNEMLDAIMKVPSAHPEFLGLARRTLSGAILVNDQQRDLWLAAAYLLSSSLYENEVEARARAHPGLVFDLRDRSGFAFRGQPQDTTLPIPVLEFMARLTGTVYPETPYPAEGSWGDKHPWDATEFCRRIINVISAMPSEAATGALVRLDMNPELASYKNQILFALANQRQRRRDADYDRPDWSQTVRALNNGSPATVADLYALLVAHLHDLKQRIERENTDTYKQFWNVDSHGKPLTPRPEELCRDVLVNLMRPILSPLGITVEPEGHMVADRRADISAAMPSRKILCELKRNYHDKVWTAAEQQLDRFYAHDPEAKGFGVYCVFWFGKLIDLPPPPNRLSRPESAAEMEQMLKDLLPDNMKSRIAVTVIDVSGLL
jgi:predicted NACHT family NTPase